ncbi:MAG TPA: R3H domain-containing nucleic acid-binding protein [Candidatus Sulfotelmatobacter sp.]|nr:R3H domain-containing nucleic acid-binding protein [Candidatus Sulfotelmatobacter sp.]
MSHEDFEGGRRRSGGRRPGSRPAPRRSGSEGEGRPRRSGPPRGPMLEPATPSVEPEAAKPARALLEEILGKMGLDDVEIVYIARSEGEYFEVRGPKLAALIGREGKTLEALNLIYNNIINAGSRNNRHYYTIDAEGYRARRADQLKTLALATLERVVREQRPIKLEPMLPSERKIVHLALADSPFVRTESEGVEPERRLVVFPKDAPAAE